MFFSPLEQFDLIIVSYKNISFFGLFSLDITIFHVLLPLALVLIFFSFLSYIFKTNFKIIPTALQLCLEMFLLFIFNLIKQQIGKEGYIYYPFFFTIFTFIFIVNLLGLIPFGIALTSQLIVILFLSLTCCLGILVIGLHRHGLEFLKIFIPESPFILLPMLILIEIFSYIIRMFSLAIRLAANIMAGHTLVFIISGGVLTLTLVKS